MTRKPFDFFRTDELDGDSEAFIAAFKIERLRGTDPKPTVNAEVSQLRSLCRDARIAGLTIRDLLRSPQLAAQLLEIAGASLSQTTVQTRARAYQRLAMQVLGEEGGRSHVEEFRGSIPQKASKGWHDAGLSIPGMKSRSQDRAPTPDAEALSAILAIGISRSLLDGAIAGLACFSGLDLDEISELRWRDVKWQDQSGAPFCEIRVLRRGHRTTCFVVAEGTKALLTYALASGLQPDLFIFSGRKHGEHLSKGAIRDRLRAICLGAGWPDLTRNQLTSALVQWLRAKDFDDHSIRLLLGRRRASTIDRLSRSANSIAAQEFMDVAFKALHDRQTI
jgi:hypothetical protein